MKLLDAYNRRLEELACHDKTCAPPPVGTGGSSGGSLGDRWNSAPVVSMPTSLPNGANPSIRRKDVLDFYQSSAAEDMGWTKAEYRNAVRAATAYGEYLKEQITNGTLNPRIRIPYDLAGTILLVDKRLKTQHESGDTVSAAFDPDYRDEIEELMYSAPETRPVYGYLGGTGRDNGYISSYGEVSVVLKDSVLDRTALVFDDSLRSETPAPVTVSEIMNLSGDELGEALIAAVSPAYSTPYRVTNAFDVSRETPNKSPWAYTEAHIHGGVTKDDIKEIVVNSKFKEPKEQAINKAIRDGGYTVVEHEGWGLSDSTFALQAALERRIEELACHDASCAPPPIGTGGSKPGGGGLPNGADVKPQREKLIAFVKEEWGYRYPSTLKAATAYGEHLKGMLEDGWEPRARISAGMAQQILIDDGELRTQHVTGNTGGGFNPDFRDEVEAEMFSAELTRPIYGYLGKDFEDTGAVWQYGDVSVVLTPETADRTTLTFGDSLGVRPAPIRITEIRELEGDELGEAVLGAYARNMLDMSSATSVRETFEMATSGGRSMPWRYIEAQIHGGVTRDDIKSVVIDAEGARRDKAFIEDLAYVLQDAGYSARIVPTDQSFTLLAALQRREEELACHDASCAPPPIGTGGSNPGGSKKWTGMSPTEDDRRKPRAGFRKFPVDGEDLEYLGYSSTEEMFKDIYEGSLGTIGDKTFSSVIDKIQYIEEVPGKRWSATVLGKLEVDDNGYVYDAGEFERRMTVSIGDDGKATIGVIHEFLRVDNLYHGMGLADRFNATAVDRYQNIGVDHIELHASLSVGPYAWARQGFRFLGMENERQDWVHERVVETRKILDGEMSAPGRWTSEQAEELKRTATALNNASKKGEDVQPIHIASIGENNPAFHWKEQDLNTGKMIDMWPGKAVLTLYSNDSSYYGIYYFDSSNRVASAYVNLAHVAHRGTFGASVSLTEALQRRLGYIQMLENYQDEPEEFGYNPNQPRDKEGRWVKIDGQWVKIDFP